MSHIEDNSPGTRTVSTELNLVPFIDLMSVCIIFLLITAVWTQVSMIQLGTSIYSKRADENIIAQQLPGADIAFRVDIIPQGHRIILGNQTSIVPVKTKGVFDHEEFLRMIEDVKRIYPEKKDVVITAADDMLYEHLVMTMDLLLKAGFSGLSIATGDVT